MLSWICVLQQKITSNFDHISRHKWAMLTWELYSGYVFLWYTDQKLWINVIDWICCLIITLRLISLAFSACGISLWRISFAFASLASRLRLLPSSYMARVFSPHAAHPSAAILLESPLLALPISPSAVDYWPYAWLSETPHLAFPVLSLRAAWFSFAISADSPFWDMPLG